MHLLVQFTGELHSKNKGKNSKRTITSVQFVWMILMNPEEQHADIDFVKSALRIGWKVVKRVRFAGELILS